ncbi:hypothetical protein GTA08_BOTSDO01229 [Botryosphaeria dothidea]|uniref:N-acetyltransferase domain-containing protein n=1 Tax=Botryosphaeria dothidea TaxID=55169 RepID=A0A8H4J4M8_9PEZI|nr:hypothetical protein GTA08_BOTSDO01229 [Botryosphaeria dothidea]
MPFKVQPTKVTDVPVLADIYFAAFGQNLFGSTCFPDTPTVRQWWCDMISGELQHQKGAAFYNLVEYAAGTDTPTFADQQKPGNIVAFAKWLRPMEGVDPQDAVEFPTDVPPEVDGDLFNRYFGELSRQHKKCMGMRAHWYLELLATHPSHQRRGAASKLINHVLADNPENARYDAYLEASPEGLSTYRRLGFEKRDEFTVEIKGQDYETLMMVRPGKRGEEASV